MARDGPAARRHRRPRRGDHDEPTRLGGHRATSRASPTRWSTAATASTASAPTTLADGERLPRLRRQAARFTEARAVQPDVQDLRRPGGGRRRAWPTCARRRRRASSSTSRTCITTSARKLPFGIAQIGKSFRNEITPGNFIFRTREFEQMEMEFFCRPARGRRVVRVLGASSGCSWYLDLGMPAEQLRLRDHDAGRAVALLDAARPTSSTPSRGAGASWRASPTAATSTCAQHAAGSAART